MFMLRTHRVDKNKTDPQYNARKNIKKLKLTTCLLNPRISFTESEEKALESSRDCYCKHYHPFAKAFVHMDKICKHHRIYQSVEKNLVSFFRAFIESDPSTQIHMASQFFHMTKPMYASQVPLFELSHGLLKAYYQDEEYALYECLAFVFKLLSSKYEDNFPPIQFERKITNRYVSTITNFFNCRFKSSEMTITHAEADIFNNSLVDIEKLLLFAHPLKQVDMVVSLIRQKHLIQWKNWENTVLAVSNSINMLPDHLGSKKSVMLQALSLQKDPNMGQTSQTKNKRVIESHTCNVSMKHTRGNPAKVHKHLDSVSMLSTRRKRCISPDYRDDKKSRYSEVTIDSNLRCLRLHSPTCSAEMLDDIYEMHDKVFHPNSSETGQDITYKIPGDHKNQIAPQSPMTSHNKCQIWINACDFTNYNDIEPAEDSSAKQDNKNFAENDSSLISSADSVFIQPCNILKNVDTQRYDINHLQLFTAQFSMINNTTTQTKQFSDFGMEMLKLSAKLCTKRGFEVVNADFYGPKNCGLKLILHPKNL